MEKILEVENLYKKYSPNSMFKNKEEYALKNVSLQLYEGETLSIVGESGSGKSTLAKIVVNILKPTSGEIIYRGSRIDNISESEYKKFRSRIQLIFQNPFASFNPKMPVESSLMEAPLTHGIHKRSEIRGVITRYLMECGLKEDVLKRYPHELSGGQLQRVSIVRALLLKPDLIIADEIVSGLDMVVQGQILETLKYLKEEKKLSMIFISHDLAVVRKISNRVIVLKEGEIVEENSSKELFSSPKIPYTKELIGAIPKFPY